MTDLGNVVKRGRSSSQGRGDEMEHWLAVRLNFGAKSRIRLYQRLARFTTRKLPLKEALESMWTRFNRTKDPRRSVFRRLVDQLVGGRTFSEAIAPYIPSAERLMIFAGEEAARIPQGFEQAIFVATAVMKMRKALIGALLYPVVLLLVLIAMLVAIAYSMVPTMLQMAPLGKWPPVSMWLYYISVGVNTLGPWILAAFVASVVIVSRTLPSWTGPVRKVFDRFVPPWTIYREYQSATFLISLSALIESGRAIDVALKQIAPISRPWMRQHIVAMVRALSSGTPPGRAIDTGLLNAEVCGDIEDYGSAGAFDQAIGAVGRDTVEDAIERITASAAIVRILMMLLVAAAILLIYTGIVFLVMEVGKNLNGFR